MSVGFVVRAEVLRGGNSDDGSVVFVVRPEVEREGNSGDGSDGEAGDGGMSVKSTAWTVLVEGGGGL